MKAAVYYETGGPDVFRYEDVDDPTCHPRGLIVDVEAVSIEGGDVLNRAGGAMAGSPHCVGYQAAGRVSEIGAEVTDIEVGTPVVTSGGFGSHAQRRSVPRNGAWVLPDDMDIQIGACIPIPFGTAHDCLFEFGHLQDGETVLIQGGAGGVGLAAVQLAKRGGARVMATASSDAKLERLAAHGMDDGINYAEVDLVEAVMRLTNNRGVNLVVDPVGGEVLAQSLRAIGYRGRVITVGNASRGEATYDIRSLAGQNQTLTGVFLGAELAAGPRAREMIGKCIADVAAGDLEVVIDKTFPLAEAEDAHRYIESRQAFGRVLLIP